CTGLACSDLACLSFRQSKGRRGEIRASRYLRAFLSKREYGTDGNNGTDGKVMVESPYVEVRGATEATHVIFRGLVIVRDAGVLECSHCED
ncbi:MAG: hypothetical protein MOB07_03450, partial [Acidobacteria bacterium]|nr:hypothetical protein [Acidobacteriota bacterium]